MTEGVDDAEELELNLVEDWQPMQLDEAQRDVIEST